ncbi:hypothetical protein [Psychrobacter alimentarius]|uniref:hypothetical protein n=1 Tax=Psychrobacter alimentarius TaxID=261164 RepID=UPI0019183994|nr:hypothetical protein [Psychrobacter alimentarius]
MTMKPFALQRLPMLCATGILSTGLLLSGCSNNDHAETDKSGAVSAADDASSTDTSEASTTQTDEIGKDTAASESVANNATEQTMSEGTQPLTANNKQKSLVTNPTQTGTPEDTVKQALDSLYQGDIKKSAEYYKVDMANFEEELAKTQSAFEQTVDGVTITDTTYNEDKTRATIVGELMLKGQSEPAPLTYELQKIDGQWKILG